MMNRIGASVIFPIIMLLTIPAPAHALFSQPAATISAGGGSSASTSYANLGVIGQPGVVGNSDNDSYTADHGFLPALGGWQLLYPIISATPGTLSFTLAYDNSDTLPLAIANSGGSTLNWTIVKGNPAETYFSFTPSSGTGAGSITVTANAVGLAAGTYNETLTISGAGITQTVMIQLSLSVTAGGTTLRVTIATDTPGKGGGSIHSDPTAIACAAGTCSGDFPPGSTVTLIQTPDFNSTWATWSPPGCGTNQECQVVMNGNQDVTATFHYSSMARVSSSGNGYESLITACGNAAATDTIYGRDVTFTENLTLDYYKAISFLGGRDAWYQPQDSFTVIQGIITLRNGSLTVDRLIVK